MGSQNRFAGMPSINIPRSKWPTNYNVTGSFKHGYLVPIDAIPVVPGDTINLKLRDLTRMQTPIAPIFGNIKQNFAAFFVPLRLVWSHAEEFFGANKTSAGYQQSTYYLPHAKFATVEVGSLSHYLGKPLKKTTESDANGNAFYVANILKERAYYLIWNEYFRAQQVTNPVLINIGDSNDSSHVAFGAIGSFGGNAVNPGAAGSLMKVAKEFDYFTASTISPQYGAAVSIPLGTKANVVAEGTSHNMGNHVKFGDSTIVGPTFDYDYASLQLAPESHGGAPVENILAGIKHSSTSFSPDIVIDRTNLIADLSNAAAAKINDIRYAFAVQKYLERSNFQGNYFFGILQVHYGVTSPDSRLQRPEFLGQFTQDILIHQVVSTADTTNSNVKTPVGGTGAMSVTATGDQYLFDKAFVEPGYIMVVRWCRAKQVYSQGVMREDFKKDRFELYTPELCNLGDQATLTREIYWKAGESDIFGYQEHWAEYRYRPDRVTGILDPNGDNSLEFWTLANKFTTKPQLNDDFVMESRSNLDRALVTADTYDEYIADTYLQLTMTREMPIVTIPGLIDHFGAM